MAFDPHFVDGRLKVEHSATVICLRRNKRKPAVPASVSVEALKAVHCKPEEFKLSNPLLQIIMSEGPLEFHDDWEILLGQCAVINYLKSTPQKRKTMRFAGEFKMGGGNLHGDETLETCAKRELFEELIRPGKLDATMDDIKLRPLSCKQTRPVRSKSNLLHNFVCIESENQFLKDMDLEMVNRNLEIQRENLASKLKDGSFWNLSEVEKEKVCPEVYQWQWIPVSQAVLHSLSSLIRGCYINPWQKDQFDFLSKTNKEKKVKKRDPMFITAVTLAELNAFPDDRSLINFCSQKNLKSIREDYQWLFNGMTREEVTAATAKYMSAGKRNPDHLIASRLETMRKPQIRLSSNL